MWFSSRDLVDFPSTVMLHPLLVLVVVGAVDEVVVGVVVVVVTGEALTRTNCPSPLTGTEISSREKRTPTPPMTMAMVTRVGLTAAAVTRINTIWCPNNLFTNRRSPLL